MGFASTYIEKRSLFPQLINETPHGNTGIVTVIPSYGEPDILRLLNSLVLAIRPECEVEVIVVVNAPEHAHSESLEQNKKTLADIESWKEREVRCWFRLFALDIKSGAIPGWGVGLARKTGMDEAVRRFSMIDNPDGIILNIDADCTVETNYFVAVYNELGRRKERKACSIYFEHPLSGSEFPESTYQHIASYELHLRYYFQGVAYSGFPYVFHTVGSAMAVRAQEYVSSGGMNRRQAGEDFYLIQKLVPSGGYFSLNSTTVYPSPRPSFRVPFGTGASISRLTEDDNSTLLTYNLYAFDELRSLFCMTDVIYDSRPDELNMLYLSIPEGVKMFVSETEWYEKISEIKSNTSGLQSFRKRFFGWFNMFKIVRYLNFVHQDLFVKKAVEEASNELLMRLGVNILSSGSRDILMQYRKMEKYA
jgi:hypothetical protein